MMSFLFACILALLKFPTFSKCESCSEIVCSNIIDNVCATIEKDGAKIYKKFQNICHLNKIKCELKYVADVRQVPDILCNIRKRRIYSKSGRRLTDFGIVGAHQACNHSCPTYCVDTYEPVCAKIWISERKFKSRPMINHCHVDLFSCAAGVNVTINPLSICYKDEGILLFMTQIAAAKSLGLVE